MQKEEFQHTPYSTNAYVTMGPLANQLLQGKEKGIAFFSRSHEHHRLQKEVESKDVIDGVNIRSIIYGFSDRTGSFNKFHILFFYVLAFTWLARSLLSKQKPALVFRNRKKDYQNGNVKQTNQETEKKYFIFRGGTQAGRATEGDIRS